MPTAFALSLLVVDDKQMALFAAFGAMALLVFVDFGGTPAERLRAYVILLLAGAVLISFGTLCSHSTWLAALAMALVAFAVLFAGVLNDYVAAASSATLLTFVLAVMVPSSAQGIPMRLAGWGWRGCWASPRRCCSGRRGRGTRCFRGPAALRHASLTSCRRARAVTSRRAIARRRRRAKPRSPHATGWWR